MTTIISAFRKCGIWPLDENAVPKDAFEPALNYTTQAAQPLPARLPTSLVPISAGTTTSNFLTTTSGPSMTTTNHSTASTTSHVDPSATSSRSHGTALRPSAPPPAWDTAHSVEVVHAIYKIAMPSPVRKTASRKALAAENDELRRITKAAGVELEKGYAHMILMDNENAELRQQLHANKSKRKRTYTEGYTRLMTSEEMMQALGRELVVNEFKKVHNAMRAEKFPAIRKQLRDEEQAAEVAEKAAKEAQKAAMKAAKTVEKATKAAEKAMWIKQGIWAIDRY
jgi:hypothetical protein